MTLNNCKALRHLQLYRFLQSRCVETNEDKPALSLAKCSPGSVDFNDVQIVQKFAG